MEYSENQFSPKESQCFATGGMMYDEKYVAKKMAELNETHKLQIKRLEEKYEKLCDYVSMLKTLVELLEKEVHT